MMMGRVFRDRVAWMACKLDHSGLFVCLLGNLFSIPEKKTLFDSSREHTHMIKTNPQAINYDYPYPTTNTLPLTTHYALVVCGALRRACPCDDDMDAKEDDCDDMFVMPYQISWKKL